MHKKNKHLQLFFAFIFIFFGSNAQLLINEYSCSNISGPTDAFGEREDWAELLNTSGTAVNLTGYYLSDKASSLTKWQIPSGTVPANGKQWSIFQVEDL